MRFLFYTVLITVQCGWGERTSSARRAKTCENKCKLSVLFDGQIYHFFLYDRLAAPPAIFLATTRVDWRETLILLLLHPLRLCDSTMKRRSRSSCSSPSPWLGIWQIVIVRNCYFISPGPGILFCNFVQLTCDSPVSSFAWHICPVLCPPRVKAIVI